VAGSWRDRTVAELLADQGLTGAAQEPFPTDGWSGARFTHLRTPDGRGFVIKHHSLADDWLAQALHDTDERESEFVDRAVTDRLPGLGSEPGSPVLPYLGAAADGPGSAILMPDLSAELIAWERPGHEHAIDGATVSRVMDTVARLHALDWSVPPSGDAELPWCPLRERITLLTPGSAERYRAAGNPVGAIFLAGWDGFERFAPSGARELIASLDGDPDPLLAALARLPAIPIHGDLKLSNVAVFDDGRVGIIDWQMIMKAPVAVELGWLLVSNVAVLPDTAERTLATYFDALGRVTSRTEDVVGDQARTRDLTWIVGLLLRGWRKGRDAATGVTLASGVPAADDLAWWCRRAVEAAERQL
jgi:hypothetical protein